MTRAGFGFIAGGGFVYLLASQTQIGWLYLFDAIIWSLLLLSIIFPWWSLRSLQIESQVLLPVADLGQLTPGGPVEDETVEVRFKVTNRGRLARHFIKLLMDYPFEHPEKPPSAFLLSSLRPKSVTVFSDTVTCYKRGHYTASRAVLQSGEPLGLVVRRRAFQLPLNLTVYPGYYRMEGLSAADAAWAEPGHSAKSIAAGEFYGSREYQHGDPLQHIHWRHTAKLGHFMLKEFEQASQSPVTVAFETGRDFGTGRETTLEYSIKIAASLARLCADSGRSIDIIAGEAPLYNAGWQEAMDYLAYLEIKEKSVLAELVRASVPGGLIVVVPAVETELIPSLLDLSGRVRGLVVVILEGFAPDEMPGEFLSRLGGSNCHVISCSAGNLETAVKRLSDWLSLAGKSPVLMG